MHLKYQNIFCHPAPAEFAGKTRLNLQRHFSVQRSKMWLDKIASSSKLRLIFSCMSVSLLSSNPREKLYFNQDIKIIYLFACITSDIFRIYN
jgi:hypothetical protein